MLKILYRLLIHCRNIVRSGYYAETDRQPEQIPSPFAGKRTPSLSSSHSHTDRPSLTFPGAKDNALRSLATTIYYLLTPDRPNGVFHMNKSAVRLFPGPLRSATKRRRQSSPSHTDHARPPPRPRRVHAHNPRAPPARREEGAPHAVPPRFLSSVRPVEGRPRFPHTDDSRVTTSRSWAPTSTQGRCCSSSSPPASGRCRGCSPRTSRAPAGQHAPAASSRRSSSPVSRGRTIASSRARGSRRCGQTRRVPKSGLRLWRVKASAVVPADAPCAFMANFCIDD